MMPKDIEKKIIAEAKKKGLKFFNKGKLTERGSAYVFGNMNKIEKQLLKIKLRRRLK